MFPDAVMIADETSGPMKADVFPTTEKSAKKRNLQGTAAARESRPSHRGSKLIGTATYICGRGETSLIMVWLYAYHGQTIRP